MHLGCYNDFIFWDILPGNMISSGHCRCVFCVFDFTFSRWWFLCDCITALLQASDDRLPYWDLNIHVFFPFFFFLILCSVVEILCCSGQIIIVAARLIDYAVEEVFEFIIESHFYGVARNVCDKTQAKF